MALDVRGTTTRSTALFQLATELPAAVLARTLGVHITVAVKWQAASGDWPAYVADVSNGNLQRPGREAKPTIAPHWQRATLDHQNHAMDAGLAGLLGGIIGAAVGALGATASAWITGRKAEQQAQIQSEAQLGQARLQIDAERTRALRESRKSAYLAFAESWHLVYGTLSEAGIKLGGIEASDPPEEREERRRAARHLWNEARALNRSLDRLQHVVYVEGPHQMGGAAQAATGALVPYFRAVLDWLHSVDHGTETPQQRSDQGRAGSDAYGKLLEFLYASSDAVSPDISGITDP
ncbi:hypothetical protein OG963_06340 [Streptomyces sp. NBC_01707]|uniref:hypothetical protein n=1 Tax=Streptomyces sp. NBC_01707 TaxID=2975914 RepID=UPI00352CD35E